MIAPEFTDEDLMAYADGELTEDRATALDLALAEDAALADRLAMFIDTRQIAADALRPMLDEPVPDHLVQRVRDLAAAAATATAATATQKDPAPSSNVVAFPERVRPSQPWLALIAASIALAFGFGSGLMWRSPAPGNPGLEIAAVSDPAVTDALATLASGESLPLADGARIEAIATFRADDGALCREFEYDRSGGATYVSVACNDGQDWQVRFAVAAAAADDTGYAPASSLDALDAYLTSTNAGAPLSSAEEAAALTELQ